MEEVLSLYQDVFKVANHFLVQSKAFTIQELAEHNEPTYGEVAKLAEQLAMIITQLASAGGWESERIALNAKQAALHMSEMALAITENNTDALAESRAKLTKITFI